MKGPLRRLSLGVSSGSTARVSNCVVVANGGVGLQNTGSVLQSLGNNLVAGNVGGDTTGTITLISGH
jgi:hypothetical protein